MKTQDEINELKDLWFSNPTWDIWMSPGFGAHAEELYMFQIEQESQGFGAEDLSVVDVYSSLMDRLSRSSRNEILGRRLKAGTL